MRGFLLAGFAAPGTDDRAALRRVFGISGAVRETRRSHRCGGADGAVTVNVHLRVAGTLVDAGRAVVPLGKPRILRDALAGPTQIWLIAAGNAGIAERVRYAGASVIELVKTAIARLHTETGSPIGTTGERRFPDFRGCAGCFNFRYGQSNREEDDRDSQ